MISRKKILLLYFLGWCLAPGELQAFGTDPHPVRARLLADVEAIAPGQSFHLGVEMRLEENWHTYWKFGGDAGRPTTIDWEMPPGFTVGSLQWPLPHKYTESGELTVYGYADENMLLAEVGPPEHVPADSLIEFKAAVSWLVCREVCIPGDTTLTLTLPVAVDGRRPANTGTFARYRAQVPAPLDLEADLDLDYTVQRKAEGLQVDVALAGRDRPLQVQSDAPDFYPSDTGDFFLESVQRLRPDGAVISRPETHAGPLQLRLGLRSYGEGEIQVLSGVLVYRLEGEEALRYGTVALMDGFQGQEPAPVGLLEMDFRLGDQSGGSYSLVIYLLLAALGGLILNLMPCVLPVISLKVLSFVSQAGAERGRIRQLGLVFAAGMVATFLGLAGVVILLKAGGEQIGWGFQFQYPGFVMAMTALIFALGLSLFGVFTVRLPGIQGSLGGLAEGESLVGSFANGVLATILATPCTAPFLGYALGFAFSQSTGVIWAIFLAIGVGMALPYVGLALEPGWMRFLPRPGTWMERFKQLMGFLLMGTVLWLLWVLGKQVGMEGVVWTGAFLLCLALACWILGQWVGLHHHRRQRLVGWVVAVAITIAGYSIFLDPVLEAEQTLAASVPQAEEEFAWQPFSVERIERLVAEGRHVFIDFTAEWCWTCKVNERVVLTDTAVRAKFAELDVALVKADWTNRNPDITALLRAFGRSGVPLYVILPGGRAQEPVVLPEVITIGLVLEKLEEAAAVSQRAGG